MPSKMLVLIRLTDIDTRIGKALSFCRAKKDKLVAFHLAIQTKNS